MPELSISDWPELVTEHITNASKPLIAIVGPTAGGKTSFAIKIAKELKMKNGKWKMMEIINADSRQLYRHLDIGTAKVTDEEKRGVPHHLMDVLDPAEEATAAWYKEEAMRAIDNCHARKAVPLLVGGSMLYVSAVIDGLEPLPKAPPELRAKLEALYDEDDGWTLYDRLRAIDPATASAFEKQNKVYVVRAMELWEMLHVPPSQLKKTVPPPYQILMIGIRWPRELLVQRIDARVRQMLASGWIEEVEGLIDRGYTAADPAMKSHGYKEIMAWLSSEERDTEALAEVIAQKTRAFAKRQMTWWEGDDRIWWLDGRQL